MVVGGSLSKTAANDTSGAKSQMSSVVNAVLVVLTLLFLAPLFESLPEATLAAVVIHAVSHPADPRKLVPVYRVSRPEFVLAVVVLVAVLALDTLPAIILGVAISILVVIYRVSFPNASELQRDKVTGSFENPAFHADAEPIPGVLVYRFEAPLIYANAGSFSEGALRLVDEADEPPRVLVVDCEEMFVIDFTGAEALEGLIMDLRERDVTVRLARLHKPVLRRLGLAGVVDELGENSVFEQIEDAVAVAPKT